MLARLGSFAWSPGANASSELKPFSDIVSISEMISRVASEGARKSGGVPDEDALVEKLRGRGLHVVDSGIIPVVNHSSLTFPITFRDDLPAQNQPNVFPYDPGFAVPLFVAAQRGLALSEVDFILSGSAMGVLASRIVRDPKACYLVQRARNTIVVAKSKYYIQNYADPGFQFERLVTGKGLEGQHDGTSIGALQLMQVGGVTVLFSAELDAVSAGGDYVEIKSSNPDFLRKTVLFQMLSSGAQTLLHAEKRGKSLIGVRELGIAEMLAEQLPSDLLSMQRSVVSALAAIKEKENDISTDFPSKLVFRGEHVDLEPRPEAESLLPKKNVVDALLLKAAEKF